MVFGQVQLANVGTLPLRYALTATASDGALTSSLVWDVVRAPTTGCPVSTATPWSGPPVVSGVVLNPGPNAMVGDVATGEDPGDRQLAVNRQELLCVRASLPVTASNSVQGATSEVELIIHAEHDIEATLREEADATSTRVGPTPTGPGG